MFCSETPFQTMFINVSGLAEVIVAFTETWPESVVPERGSSIVMSGVFGELCESGIACGLLRAHVMSAVSQLLN